MSAASADVLRWGRERVRVAPYRGDTEVAFLSPEPDGPPPSIEFLMRCLDELAERGYRQVVTGALSPLEQAGYIAAGFDVHEHLHLLGITLGAALPPVPEGVPLLRGRRRRSAVLAVDRLAFSPFWQFDDEGLTHALEATPQTRFRAAVGSDGAVVGYAVCGRAGTRGFVQRLAVDPSAQRAGTGSRLLLDGLHWMKRHGVRRAIVNTQVGNDAALSLYHRVGFRDEPTGLSVLSAGLT
jgi:ribosomal protein S18 acetylase RimI-like enzyme